MFSIYDVLICINNTSRPGDQLGCPLVLNQEYNIRSLKKCKCGQVFVDIGLALNTDEYNTGCIYCRERFYDNVWWFDHKRFKKKGVGVSAVEISEMTFDQLQELIA
jgi:hypothetical protein